LAEDVLLLPIMKLYRTLIPLTVIFSIILIIFNLQVKREYHSLLAGSFLNGKVYFLEQPTPYWLDTTPFGGENYSFHGPLPALISVPFVYLFGLWGMKFYQGYLQIILAPVIFSLIYSTAVRIGYDKKESLYISFAFFFSTAFLGSIMWPEAIAHTLVVTFLFFAIYLQLKNYNYIFPAAFIGFSALTRISTLPALLFPTGGILFNKKTNVIVKLRRLIPVAVLIAVLFCSLGFYNWIRFGDALETGYKTAINLPSSSRAREYGVLSLYHLPGNLYYFLLAGPIPVFRDGVSHVLRYPFIMANPWGMSIFVTSPIFFYLFFLSYKDKLSKIIIITTLSIAIPIFFYYGIGFRQFGYRYSLDFLPFLFLLLIKDYHAKYGRLSGSFKVFILLSSISNLLLFLTAL
jgi:hypothetical protein